jgi:uncharacterized OsmC-like protein/alpha/beta superfamily hydrolase
MKQQSVRFESARGVELAGLLDLPAGRPRAYALFAHCFTCTKNLRAVRHIASALAAQGIAVLRFDFTGLGQSEGEFADSNFSTNVEDLVAAARFLESRYEAPRLLIGHSLGGTAVLQAAAQIESSEAVATIGSPARASHVEHLLRDARTTLERDGVAEVHLAGRPFLIRRQFLEDLERHPLPDSVRSLRRALLVMHSPVDTTVEIDNAAEIFEHAMHPKSFVTLDGADHLLSREQDSRYVGAMLATWAGRYLDPQRLLEQAPTAAAGEAIARTGPVGLRTLISAGGHALAADEPMAVGGEGRGPTPYELLAAGLAACTSMTLQMYARRKQWPLESVTTAVAHDRIHAADCADCEAREGRIDRFTRRLELEGAVDPAQRARLLEIANRCPVHRTLHAEVEVVTEAGNG